MIDAGCELLPWDTEFFGVRVARFGGGTLDRDALHDVEAWCRAREVDCLYFLADARSDEQDAWLREAGFKRVDGRVTLECEARPVGRPEGLRLAEDADLPVLTEIAGRSHRATRFYSDPRFAPAAERLYRYWIARSVADSSVAVFVPASRPTTGYITCYAADARVGQIGLLGVSEAARGQGIGRRLVEAAIRWSADRSSSRVRVVTQAGNDGALGVYGACGFVPVRTQWWYHRWFTSRSVE